MTIQKIISGGQTGADRAALDFAIEYGIEHGGWVPAGRKAEDGTVPLQYNLTELSGGDYADRTAQNVIDADGTLIVSHGEMAGGTLLTWKMAKRHGKPVLHADLWKMIAFDAAIDVHEWIEDNDIDILNVAGPRESKDPTIYQATRNLLETVFHIDIIADSMPGTVMRPSSGKTAFPGRDGMPATVEEAVSQLMNQLSPMDKTRIASAKREQLRDFSGLLKHQFGLAGENRQLIAECKKFGGYPDTEEPDALMVILRVFREKLRQSGHLRIVK